MARSGPSERLMKTSSWWAPRVGRQICSTSPKLSSSETNRDVVELHVSSSRCRFKSLTITHPAKDEVRSRRSEKS